MKEKVVIIREWLGSGAVNVFGLPMSGKDTVGVRLADELGAKFLSSGDMLRKVEAETGEILTKDGLLSPTDRFREVVLPYFYREDLRGEPLVLSSVGRWSGEEGPVMEALSESGHPVKAAVLLQVSEDDVWQRWEAAKILADRDGRDDDGAREIFEKRLVEFAEKTGPVLEKYKELGLLLEVRADGSRDEVFEAVVDALLNRASA